jgi:hypothetical protein
VELNYWIANIWSSSCKLIFLFFRKLEVGREEKRREVKRGREECFSEMYGFFVGV